MSLCVSGSQYTAQDEIYGDQYRHNPSDTQNQLHYTDGKTASNQDPK